MRTTRARVSKMMKDVSQFCATNHIKFVNTPKKRVSFYDSDLRKRVYCSGFFQDNHDGTASLYIATGKPKKDWIPVFLHEFSHAVQCVNKDRVYEDMVRRRDYEAVLSKYVRGSRLVSKRLAFEAVKKTILMELDCERKALRYIKKYKLEGYLNIEELTQKANSYLLFHHVYFETKKWYKVAPYEIKAVWSKMPKKLIKDPTTITEEQRSILKTIYSY